MRALSLSGITSQKERKKQEIVNITSVCEESEKANKMQQLDVYY